MKGNLLVTGASGFLGYHLVQAAVSAGYSVFAGVRPSSDTAHFAPGTITRLNLDFSDVPALTRMLAEHRITHVIHAAASTKAKDQAAYNRANADYTRNIALAAMATGIPLEKFVFISSLAALGPSRSGEPIRENNQPHPVTWYGNSKRLAEQYLRDIAGLPLIGLRPTAVYGPREKDLLVLIKTLCKGLEVYIGRNSQRLSFVYVSDLADVTVKSLESERTGEFYNVSDGKIYDRYAFSNAAKQATGRKTVKLQLPLSLITRIAGLMDILYSRSAKTPVLNRDKINELTASDWSCSIEKINQDLGFRPAYDLQRGMDETISWYKSQHWI